MLKRAYAYQDHNKWYLGLNYTYEDDKGKHEVIFPKVNLPVTQLDLPTIAAETEDYSPYLRHPHTDYKIIQDGDFYLFEASAEDPRNGEKLEGGFYYDILVAPKVHKMTVEEIEKKLGYKVEIVSKK